MEHAPLSSSLAPTLAAAPHDLLTTADHRRRDVSIMVPALVGGAMFMPWLGLAAGGRDLAGTGWNSYIELFNIAVPNWMVLGCAVAAVGLGVLGRGWASGPPRGLIRAVVLLAVAQCADVFFTAAFADGGTAGVGPVVSAIALVAYLLYGIPRGTTLAPRAT